MFLTVNFSVQILDLKKMMIKIATNLKHCKETMSMKCVLIYVTEHKTPSIFLSGFSGCDGSAGAINAIMSTCCDWWLYYTTWFYHVTSVVERSELKAPTIVVTFWQSNGITGAFVYYLSVPGHNKCIYCLYQSCWSGEHLADYIFRQPYHEEIMLE